MGYLRNWHVLLLAQMVLEKSRQGFICSASTLFKTPEVKACKLYPFRHTFQGRKGIVFAKLPNKARRNSGGENTSQVTQGSKLKFRALSQKENIRVGGPHAMVYCEFTAQRADGWFQ